MVKVICFLGIRVSFLGKKNSQQDVWQQEAVTNSQASNALVNPYW